jgi:hypothetical protein
MKLGELDKRYLIGKCCIDIGKWEPLLVQTAYYPGNLGELRKRAEQLIDFIDLVELDQWRAGNNPRLNQSG